MPKLRFAFVLPILMLCIAFPVMRWQEHINAASPRGEFPIVPTVTLVYAGLNAPAVLFKGLCMTYLPVERIDHPPSSVFGIDSGQFLFFAGVVVLWFTVGLLLDRRRKHQTSPKSEASIQQTVMNLSLLAFGIPLFGGGVWSIRHGYSNPVGNLLQGVLWLGWSLLFALPSGLKLLTRFRSIRTGPTV
jgi:hypothetical protein